MNVPWISLVYCGVNCQAKSISGRNIIVGLPILLKYCVILRQIIFYNAEI
ncbi:hypothetical protein EMGBS3_12390 [Anaerolineaceae bacterium]|nr:hypothetical protein EMGBS3_12390 [Anaerolineaceae bacterium]